MLTCENTCVMKRAPVHALVLTSPCVREPRGGLAIRLFNGWIWKATTLHKGYIEVLTAAKASWRKILRCIVAAESLKTMEQAWQSLPTNFQVCYSKVLLMGI